MSLTRIEPPEPPQQRSPWLITLVLVLIVLLLALALWFFNLGDWGLRLVATPTPSGTPAAFPTATPDFRSTLIAEDQITQIAFLATVTQQTLEPSLLPMVGGVGDATATLSINLPIVSGMNGTSPLPTPTPAPNQPSDLTQVNLPGVSDGVASPSVDSPVSPLDAPTSVPVVIGGETPTPSETPFIPATDTPTVTPTPSPTVFYVSELRGIITQPLTGTPVWLRPAPMTTHTPFATMEVNSVVRLLGRDETGEWVYLSYANSSVGWVRQVNAPPRENSLPTNAPPNATPNDVRWLPTQPWPGNLPQAPVATPIPPDDYPMPRRDRANTGRVPLPYGSALRSSLGGSTPRRFTTPVVAGGQYVIVANEEPAIYGFDRLAGNQLWKLSVSAIKQPLLLQDNILYYAEGDLGSGSGRAVAIPVGESNPVWSVNLTVAASASPATGFVAAGNRLFIGVFSNNTYYILQMDRGAGATFVSFPLGDSAPKPLTIGHQLLYVANKQLWALDIDNLEQVWTRADLINLTSAPVYSANGITALAELYVSVNDGRTLALDANTGATLHTYQGNGEEVKSLALGDNALYVVTTHWIRAFDRRSDGNFWNTQTAGETIGGAIVTPNQLILVSVGGAVQYVDPNTGAISAIVSVPSPGSNAPAVTNAPAVSGPILFVPSDNGQVYGFTQ